MALIRVLLCAGLLLFPGAVGRAATIDFESLADGDIVTTQFAGLGVTFANAIALGAGFSLNEFEFPPASGAIVVSDDGGPIQVTFATSVSSLRALVTYLVPLTLTAFDASDTVLATTTSLFGSNLALSGAPGSGPNELLELVATGIVRVEFAGDPWGGSFVLDDLTFTAVPEPGTLVLVALGLAAWRMRRRR